MPSRRPEPRRQRKAAPADSSLADLARESGAGFVVQPLTAMAVAELVRTLDPAALPTTGRQGREFVRGRYSRPAVSAAYLRLIESAAGE